MAWDGGSLALADGGVERVRRPYLSPSSASAVNQCPARHAAERTLPRTEHPFGDAELGTAGHTILEELYGLPAKQRTRQAARDELTKLWRAEKERFPELTEKRVKHRWLGAVWMRVRGVWQIEDPTRVMVRRTEWALGDSGRKDDNGRTTSDTGPVLIEGVPFVGIIDRSDIDGDEFTAGTSVLDYKTGKPSTVSTHWVDSHGDQLRLYAAAVESIDGRLPLSARVFYTRYGKSRFVSLAEDEMEATKSRFRQAWDDLNTYAEQNRFPAKPSGLCPWCPLVASCPAAKEAGRDAPAAKDGTVIYLPVAKRRIAPPPKPQFAAKTPDGDHLDVPVHPSAELAALDEVFDSAAERDEYGFVIDGDADPRPARSNQTAMGNGRRPPTFSKNNKTSTGDKHMLAEGKPWDATINGTLNPTSYSAIAVFGTVTMAVKALAEADQPITGTTVNALSGTFASIVEAVQVRFTGSSSPQDGMNTRLRGALHTAVETLPIPFGGTSAEWEAWVDAVTKRVSAIAKAAVRLFENGPDSQPWADLAVDPEDEDIDLDDFDFGDVA